MIFSQLPALQVTVPLIAAPLCLLARSGRIAWAIALSASAASFVVAVLLLSRVLDQGSLSYEFGGWAAPWGIEYRVDIDNVFVLFVITAITTIVLFFANDSVRNEVDADRQSLFYTVWLLCITG